MNDVKTYRVRDMIGEASSTGTIVFEGELKWDIFVLPNYPDTNKGTLLIPAIKNEQKYFVQTQYEYHYNDDSEKDERETVGAEELISYGKGVQLVKEFWKKNNVPELLQADYRTMRYIDGVRVLIMAEDRFGHDPFVYLYNSKCDKNQNGDYGKGRLDMFIGYSTRGNEWMFLEIKENTYRVYETVKEYLIPEGLDVIIDVEFKRCFES